MVMMADNLRLFQDGSIDASGQGGLGNNTIGKVTLRVYRGRRGRPSFYLGPHDQAVADI